MNSFKAEYQVEEMAQALEVSSSGFQAHQHKPQGRVANRISDFWNGSSRSLARAVERTAARASRPLCAERDNAATKITLHG